MRLVATAFPAKLAHFTVPFKENALNAQLDRT